MSFIPACGLDWSYNCGMFEDDYTEREENVTCPECLKTLKEWSEDECLEKDLTDLDQESSALIKEILTLL